MSNKTNERSLSSITGPIHFFFILGNHNTIINLIFVLFVDFVERISSGLLTWHTITFSNKKDVKETDNCRRYSMHKMDTSLDTISTVGVETPNG